MASTEAITFPRYEPQERPPALLAASLVLQTTLLSIPGAVLLPIVMFLTLGGSVAEMSWVAFVTLIFNGVSFVWQSVRTGPLGAGLTIITYPSVIAISYCVIAVREGGPSTLAALVVISSLFQVLLSMRLSMIRRFITPTMSGTFLVLLCVNIVALLGNTAVEAPDGASAFAGPMCMAATLLVSLVILLRFNDSWRVWAPVIGIAGGCAVAVALGLYDLEPFNQASVVGLPVDGWPGFGFDFGSVFWSLLPAFLLISMLFVMQASSVCLATQQAVWRRPRATDYRRIEGSAGSMGICSALAGLFGGIPFEMGPRGLAMTHQTGCASLHIGLLSGVALVASAFFPKVWSLLVGIPASVTLIYLMVLMSPLIIEGMRLVLREAPGYRQSLIVGIAVFAGLVFQFNMLQLPASGVWGPMFQNGLTSGALVLVALTVLTNIGTGRTRRMQTKLNAHALPQVNEFLRKFSSDCGLGPETTTRMQAVAEETIELFTLEGEDNAPGYRRLLMTVRNRDYAVDLEFVTAPGDSENLQDRISLLNDPVPGTGDLGTPRRDGSMDPQDIPLRLLSHYASSVSHRQYHEAQVITVSVAASAEER